MLSPHQKNIQMQQMEFKNNFNLLQQIEHYWNWFGLVSVIGTLCFYFLFNSLMHRECSLHCIVPDDQYIHTSPLFAPNTKGSRQKKNGLFTVRLTVRVL